MTQLLYQLLIVTAAQGAFLVNAYLLPPPSSSSNFNNYYSVKNNGYIITHTTVNKANSFYSHTKLSFITNHQNNNSIKFSKLKNNNDNTDNKNQQEVIMNEGDDTTTSTSISGRTNTLAKKVEGRKKRVITGYKITSLSNLLLGITISALTRNPYFSAGSFLIAGISYILSDAAVHNRLSSDTYKRLNIALGLSIFIESLGGVLMKIFFPWQLFIGFIGVVNSIKGYGYGLKSWELNNYNACVRDDIVKGMKSSVATMIKVPNLNSAFYLASTIMVTSMTFLKLMEVIQLSLSSSSKGYMIGTRLYRLRKLILMSVVCFTLKDAADRDRLQGTTFIELNYLISFVFAALSVYLYKIVGTMNALGGASLIFSAHSLVTGLSFALKKRNE